MGNTVSVNVKRLMFLDRNKGPKPLAINITKSYSAAFRFIKCKLSYPYTELSEQEQLIWSCKSFEEIVARPYFETHRYAKGVPEIIELIDKVVAESWTYHYYAIRNVIPLEYKSFMDEAEVRLSRLQKIYAEHNLLRPRIEKPINKKDYLNLQIKNSVPIFLTILNRKGENLTEWDIEKLRHMQALIESYILSAPVKHSDKGYQELL